MAVFSMLDSVMTALGLQGNTFQEPTIQVYIDEVNEYLLDAGVPASVIGTRQTVGIVVRGVADLWNYGAGNGKLSPYFHERAIQLATKPTRTATPTPTPTPTPPPTPSPLPDVTPADDGKVLTVEGGKWKAAEPKQIIQATITILDIERPNDTSSPIVCSCDKTYTELYSAYSSGIPILWNLEGITVVWDNIQACVKPEFGYWRRGDEFEDIPAFFNVDFYIIGVAYGYNPPQRNIYYIDIILDANDNLRGDAVNVL